MIIQICRWCTSTACTYRFRATQHLLMYTTLGLAPVLHVILEMNVISRMRLKHMSDKQGPSALNISLSRFPGVIQLSVSSSLFVSFPSNN